MNSTFLICGYPRSRTMWLSKFLTVEGISVCNHEATEFAGSAEEFWANAEKEAADCEYYGNSDAANIFVLPSLLAERPLTQVVWIERDMIEVARSMKNIGMPINELGLNNLMTMRQVHQKHFDLIIGYEALHSGDVCKMVWDLCLPKVPFDWARWGAFQHQNIGYSKTNPWTHKNTDKLLGWAQREIDDLRAENIIK